MDLVRARLGHDPYLPARPLAVFGAVGVAQHVEFPHRIDAQQLLAGSSGLHVVFRRAGVLDAIQQKQILLRPIAGDREIVSRVEFDTPMPPVFSAVKLTMPGFSVSSKS